MTSSAPQIGFDRFIRHEWFAAAFKARAGNGSIEELDSLLDAAQLGVDAKRKTKIVLKRLWLDPRPELTDFADRAIAIYKEDPSVSLVALTWGMAIATYPFFAKVAELVGRLSALQGGCAAAEVHRRMSEVFGEREGTYRMTRMVLQSQSDWGTIERVEGGKRILRTTPIVVSNEGAVAWLAEGAVRCVGKAVAVASLQTLPVLFPLTLEGPVSYIISNAANLELRSEGGTNQLVRLRQ